MQSDDDEIRGFLSKAYGYVREEVFRSPCTADGAGVRNNALMRWAKFAAIVLVLAAGFGTGAAVEYIVEEYDDRTFIESSFARSHVEDEGKAKLKLRFAIGAATGGALGLIYAGLCIKRRAEP